jgi:8-oxo-dGTP pyrophosphatase MutT (NUDIX family)
MPQVAESAKPTKRDVAFLDVQVVAGRATPAGRLAQSSFFAWSYDLSVERRQRVVVYVERRGDLLVFEHRDHPEARTQVPAGGVEPDEDVRAAAAREVAEETGVILLAEPMLLGTHDHLDGLGQPATSHFFRVDAPPGLPDQWEHVVSGRGEDADLVFLCRFDTDPALWPVQAVFRV